MSFVNSQSTDAQVWAAYDDNTSYDATGSVQSCQAFIVACRILLRRLPEMIANGRGQVRNNPLQIENEIKAAQIWLASNSDNSVRPGGVGYFSLNNSRD